MGDEVNKKLVENRPQQRGKRVLEITGDAMKHQVTNDLGRIPRLGIANFAVPEVSSMEPRQSPEMFSISESMRKRGPQRRPSSSTPSIARLVNPYGRCVRKNEVNIVAN